MKKMRLFAAAILLVCTLLGFGGYYAYNYFYLSCKPCVIGHFDAALFAPLPYGKTLYGADVSHFFHAADIALPHLRTVENNEAQWLLVCGQKLIGLSSDWRTTEVDLIFEPGERNQVYLYTVSTRFDPLLKTP